MRAVAPLREVEPAARDVGRGRTGEPELSGDDSVPVRTAATGRKHRQEGDGGDDSSHVDSRSVRGRASDSG